MDINYLLHRQQVEMMRADSAGGREARIAHRRLADAYSDRIRKYRAVSVTIR